MAVLPIGDYHRIAFVTWLAHDSLGVNGLPSFATRAQRDYDIELRLPESWSVPPVALRVRPIWSNGDDAILRVAGSDGLEQERYAQIVGLAARGRLTQNAEPHRRRTRSGRYERRSSARYATRGLGVRINPGDQPWQVLDVSTGGFTARAVIPTGPPRVFELVGDERWQNVSVWVTGQVVRSDKVSAVRAYSANYDRYLTLVDLARRQQR